MIRPNDITNPINMINNLKVQGFDSNCVQVLQNNIIINQPRFLLLWLFSSIKKSKSISFNFGNIQTKIPWTILALWIVHPSASPSSRCSLKWDSNFPSLGHCFIKALMRTCWFHKLVNLLIDCLLQVWIFYLHCYKCYKLVNHQLIFLIQWLK